MIAVSRDITRRPASPMPIPFARVYLLLAWYLQTSTKFPRVFFSKWSISVSRNSTALSISGPPLGLSCSQDARRYLKSYRAGYSSRGSASAHPGYAIGSISRHCQFHEQGHRLYFQPGTALVVVIKHVDGVAQTGAGISHGTLVRIQVGAFTIENVTARKFRSVLRNRCCGRSRNAISFESYHWQVSPVSWLYSPTRLFGWSAVLTLTATVRCYTEEFESTNSTTTFNLTADHEVIPPTMPLYHREMVQPHKYLLRHSQPSL